MISVNLRMPIFPALAALCLCLFPAVAQTKPPESASKVKKVLLYNKVGGWSATKSIAEIKAMFSDLSAAKGFELIQLDGDSVITLDYLKQFQVIVWNNNSDGAGSVPNSIARQAVIDYLDQGGGWLLIHKASDHQDTWPALAETIGAKFKTHAGTFRGEVVLDEAASAHRELKWMIEGLPENFRLDDLWLSFNKTVRPLPGVTVVATSRVLLGLSGGEFLAPADGSGDNAYIWAREVGKGRFFYNAIGFWLKSIMVQPDNTVPELYWENLRYLAGDYQNGCTTPVSLGFDPAARVHVEAMCLPSSLKTAPARSSLILSKGNFRMRTASPGRALQVRLRDLRGAVVWESAMPAGTHEITLDAALSPGVYHYEVRGEADAIQRILVLP